MTPESGSPATWYGSLVHEVIQLLEEGFSEEMAVEKAWGMWGAQLGPDELALLHEDIATFRERDFEGVRTVLAEGEIAVPLTEVDGQTVWFRAKIDRLYERLDRPGHFVHVDYKTSKWLKTQDEVDTDRQMWAYNWAIMEFFPECDTLEQHYDQLRFGVLETNKDHAQRQEIKEWLVLNARNYFGPQDLQEDGLPAPRFNRWCPWCSIMESCPIIPQLTDWALTRIEALSPDESLGDDLTPLDQYLAAYDHAQTAQKVLERFSESVKGLLREMPSEDRAALGFELQRRSYATFTPQGKQALYEEIGHEQFLKLANVTQTALKKLPEDERDLALKLMQKLPGPQVLQRRKR